MGQGRSGRSEMIFRGTSTLRLRRAVIALSEGAQSPPDGKCSGCVGRSAPLRYRPSSCQKRMA
ncbi:hypothetical protein C725_1611 [Pacificimonas flava]|uniref:Uncharacterized protein n=1 Tax=Pacificimonas flava TaxID=1234595 RepID=M2U4U9_9SPHN|nr:hypothetical protein C725_1611 [Pacificimonas flava]